MINYNYGYNGGGGFLEKEYLFTPIRLNLKSKIKLYTYGALVGKIRAGYL